MTLGQLCEALRAGLAFRLKLRGIDATGSRLPELNKRKKREMRPLTALSRSRPAMCSFFALGGVGLAKLPTDCLQAIKRKKLATKLIAENP